MLVPCYQLFVSLMIPSLCRDVPSGASHHRCVVCRPIRMSRFCCCLCLKTPQGCSNKCEFEEHVCTTPSSSSRFDGVRFSILCCTHIFLCPVMSYCSDLGPDCTGGLAAWTLHLLCAGEHIRHLPSLSLVVLLVADCVWNHLLSLRY